jgi:glycosyltransferase involved in cell wall biosynthesis
VKLHLVALPHVRLGTHYTKLCAYSGKVVNFCKMMKDKYQILLYAPDSDLVEGAEMVDCLSDMRRQEIFGEDEPNRLYAWPSEEQFAPFNLRVIEEIKHRIAADDIILLSAGYSHISIAKAFPNNFLCEPFIGMEGIIGGNCWGAYESHTHMAAMYQRWGVKDIRYFDTVIPPYYDPDDFPKMNKGNGNYLLFIGRLILRKGPNIAAEIANACNLPLVVAGSGATEWGPHHIKAPEVTIHSPGELRYVGPVGTFRRNELMADAIAVLAPTTYREPGGNVAIEAMACGTPAITTDFGVFAETVPQRFRFRTLKEAVEAVHTASTSKPKSIRRYAQETFSFEAIEPRFTQWFENIRSLRGKGWYTL